MAASTVSVLTSLTRITRLWVATGPGPDPEDADPEDANPDDADPDPDDADPEDKVSPNAAGSGESLIAFAVTATDG